MDVDANVLLLNGLTSHLKSVRNSTVLYTQVINVVAKVQVVLVSLLFKKVREEACGIYSRRGRLFGIMDKSMGASSRKFSFSFYLKIKYMRKKDKTFSGMR